MADGLCVSLNFFLFFIIPSLLLADSGDRHVRYEYKYSFKGPHLMNKLGQVPFWTFGGSAIPSNDQVRITPSLRDQKGFLWTANKFTSEWWEIEGHFRVTGRGRIGADGFAIWYTEKPGSMGPVFGSSEHRTKTLVCVVYIKLGFLFSLSLGGWYNHIHIS